MRLIRFYSVLCIVAFAGVFSAWAEESAPIGFSLNVLWRAQAEGPVRGGALIDEGLACFGSADGFLYAVDARSGVLRWKFDAGGPVASRPVRSQGLFIAVTRGGSVYAVDRMAGTLVWRAETGGPMAMSYPGWDYFDAAPIVAGERLLVGSGDGSLYCFSAASGERIWAFATKGRIRAAPAIDESTAYVASADGSVYALDLISGRELWRFDTLGATLNSQDFGFDRKSIYTPPVVADGALIFGSRDGHVYAVDLATRTQRWAFTYGSTWAMALTVADGVAYVGWSTNNLVCAIDIATGSERWKIDAGSHTYAAPFVAEDGLLIASANGIIRRLDTRDGAERERYQIDCELYGAPVVADGILYVGADDGGLYALERSESAALAVYRPAQLPEKLGFALVDDRIAPFLVSRGFELLESPLRLQQFLAARAADGRPSTVVFAFADIPAEALGDQPEHSGMRRYLESGGKALWFGTIPNLHGFDAAGNYRRDATIVERLLSVHFDATDESGCYANRATQAGRNMGLPVWFTAMNANVRASDVTPLALDEFGRVGAWIKSFSDRPGSGFLSCRSWSFNVAMAEEDLALIDRLARYGLD